MSNIFISYSHQDEAWKERLLKQLKVLEKQAVCAAWHDRDIEIGGKWYNEIINAIEKANIFILLVSADFLGSDFILNEEIPRIKERHKNHDAWVIPVIIKHCDWKSNSWLAGLLASTKDGIPLDGRNRVKIEKELAALAEKIRKRIQCAPGVLVKPIHKPLAPEKISLAKMPGTGADVFGREKELAILDNAWNDAHTHIVILQAWGGVGKTALVNYWLNLLEKENYMGAAKVYAWSFYSQGAEEGKQASADEFFQETLQFFSDPHPEQGSNVEKGRHLATLVRKEKNLIILDGLEPIQYPPGEIHGFDGKLKDAGLSMFLKELAADMPGLCVISTREKVQDLQPKKGFAVKEIELENLSETAGVQLLKNLGVTTGSEKDFNKAVEEYGGHALSLTLLGNYIKKVFAGDIRKRDEIGKLAHDKIPAGRHAHRVMAAYERWLGASPERDILYLLGLFDRPVEPGAIEALKKAPVINGVTNKLQGISDQDWQLSLSNLREAGLMAGENPHKPGMLDAHPLVREYFGNRLRQQNPQGWQAAHKRLYEYYKALPKKFQPDTLQEMEPLFAAVAHGCRAGLHREAWNDIYRKRIIRGNEYYCTKKLGAFGSDLASLSHFFEVTWSQPAQDLTDDAKAVSLAIAAFDLRALGRLTEAIQPMRAGLEMRIKQENWKNAAIAANNLSELLLTLGDVTQAVSYARQSVDYADRSGDNFEKESDRTTLADALHQAGQIDEAEKLFLQAEAMQKKSQPQFPYLYSLPGYRFCDLMLGQGKYQEALKRAGQTQEWAEKYLGLLDVALDQLTLGRAWLLNGLDPENKKNKDRDGAFKKANEYLDQAIAGLRKAGQQQYLAPGLILRAEYWRIRQQYDLAQQDLAEALEIAELGSMKLYLVDYHIESGRLRRAQGRDEDAQEHVQQAASLIEETGYHRRDQEIEGYIRV